MATEPDDTPEIIAAWIAQLLTDDMARLVTDRDGQIEVRLYANRGKVRKHPTILLNAGPQNLIDPDG